jgi:hypothetical protein
MAMRDKVIIRHRLIRGIGQSFTRECPNYSIRNFIFINKNVSGGVSQVRQNKYLPNKYNYFK